MRCPLLNSCTPTGNRRERGDSHGGGYKMAINLSFFFFMAGISVMQMWCGKLKPGIYYLFYISTY
jgi:hypothetical protein